MSDKPADNLVQEAERLVHELLASNEISEEQKVAILKDVLAIINEQD